jgi:hypothetical protein
VLDESDLGLLAATDQDRVELLVKLVVAGGATGYR